jgi:hypothetical protein
MTTPKDQKPTFKNKKGGIHPQVSPHTQLRLILLILNLFSLYNQGITPMEKHFDAWDTCRLLRVL